MQNHETTEYTSRHRMEETTAKVLARIQRMKNVLCRSVKKRSHFCGTISNYESYSDTNQSTQSTIVASNASSYDDTISSISSDSSDSGVSTLSNVSDCSSCSSSMSSLHRGSCMFDTRQFRCDPSFINFLSHDLIGNEHSSLCLSSSTTFAELPLAESSRQIETEHEQTMLGDDDDEMNGPLTSTLIDRWHSITKPYSAVFREDLTVRKNELVQIVRSTHPHWLWVRNENNEEGFIPTDCLLVE